MSKSERAPAAIPNSTAEDASPALTDRMSTMQRHAKNDREWEQWPGRGAPDDETRGGRLRGLFTPTDAADAVADLIAERGRELEERSAQIRAAVEELEHREERARELHFRVEQILREGAAELDLRQAELSVRSAELDARETAVAKAEAAVEDRRRTLGAVELRAAAVERREEALRLRETELEHRAAELAELARQLEEVGSALEDARRAAPRARTSTSRSRPPTATGSSYARRRARARRPGRARRPELPLRADHGLAVPRDDRRCAVLELVPADEDT